MPSIIATPGAANANCYCTFAEAEAYFETRVFASVWTGESDDDVKIAALIMATRTLNALAQPFKTFVPAQGGINAMPAYYRSRRQWTGAAATTTQRLAWPRTGMYDANGNLIASDAIPQDLKDATAELAMQLMMGDRTLDNDAIVQGLSSLKAGSVALTWKEGVVPQVIPDAVYNLMPASWLTEEVITPVYNAEFDVV